MLPRISVRYLSTQTTSVTPLPELKWDNLSSKSQSRIRNLSGSLGLASLMGTYALTYDPDCLEIVITSSLACGGAGTFLGRWIGYSSSPEAAILNSFKQRNELEAEFTKMQKNPLFVVSQNPNSDDLQSQLQKINYTQTHPLVEAFEFWKKDDNRLVELENKAQSLSIQHETLLQQVSPIFQIPMTSKLITDLESSRQRLQESMINIKKIPNWFERLTSYNQEKTKEAAQEAATNTREAREAAESAKTMATVSAVASIIRR